MSCVPCHLAIAPTALAGRFGHHPQQPGSQATACSTLHAASLCLAAMLKQGLSHTSIGVLYCPWLKCQLLLAQHKQTAHLHTAHSQGLLTTSTQQPLTQLCTAQRTAHSIAQHTAHTGSACVSWRPRPPRATVPQAPGSGRGLASRRGPAGGGACVCWCEAARERSKPRTKNTSEKLIGYRALGL